MRFLRWHSRRVRWNLMVERQERSWGECLWTARDLLESEPVRPPL